MDSTSTRDHIILVAFKLFLRSNYRDVTINDLVEESGLSRGAFYHYFSSKQDLFVATVDWLFEQLSKGMISPDGSTSLRTFFFDHMTWQDTRLVEFVQLTGCKDMGVNLYKFVFNAVEYYPGFMPMVQKIQDNERDMWRKAIRDAQARGEIRRDISADIIARHISVMLDGIGVQAMFNGRPNQMNEWAEELFEQYYELLA